MKQTACAALCAFGSLYALAARAQPPGEPPRTELTDQARDHFQRGVEFYKELSFDAALAEFSRAYELQANYRVLFNLGQVQLERHDYVSALKMFRGYLDAGGDEIPAARRDQVERDIEMLRRRVAELQIKCNVPGAEVLVDGAIVAKTPLPAPLLINPGFVHVTVQKPGYVSATSAFSAVGAEQKSIDITLNEQGMNAAPQVGALETDEKLPPRSPASHINRTPFWIGLGVTGAFTIGAGVFALQAHKDNDHLDRKLDEFPGDDAAVSSARSQLKRDALITDVLTGGAVLAAGFTVYFALSARSSEEPKKLGLRPSVRARGLELFATF